MFTVWNPLAGYDGSGSFAFGGLVYYVIVLDEGISSSGRIIVFTIPGDEEAAVVADIRLPRVRGMSPRPRRPDLIVRQRPTRLPDC